jgi:Cu-Zn family superoxide dismutase
MNRVIALTAFVCLLLVAACGDAHDHANGSEATGGGDAWPGVDRAVCVLTSTDGNAARGTIRFTKVEGGVQIVGSIEGLVPNQKHAIHIHQYGDITGGDGKTTGGHYNPEGHDHALPDSEMRHAGDFGNLEADAKGVAKLELTVTNITIAGPKNPIVGRGMIVHAKPDDGGQPTGNAGARIAHGVIGIAK